MKYKYIILFLIIFILYFLFYNNYELFIDKQMPINKIYILHGEVNFHSEVEGNIKFMLKPAIDSITKLLNEKYPSVPIIYKKHEHNFEKLIENDILIWVGDINENIVDYNDLRNRNIYSIYYNTEPDTRNFNSNEIWTYSKYLFSNYEKQGEQLIKFVPVICDDSTNFISYKNINPKDLKLYFIGNFGYRRDKVDIIMKNNFMIDKLLEIYNIWNEEDYIRFITDQKSPKIFLNLTKSVSNVLPGLRINKLLSNKCIVISEHTNSIDEEYYKDIVYFTDLDKIADLFIELTNKTSDELEMESETRYQKFNQIFNYKNASNLISVK